MTERAEMERKFNSCLDCDAYDSDMGCTMSSLHKWYACPIESETEENQKQLEEYAEWVRKTYEAEFVNCTECLYYDECENKESMDGCYAGERENNND